MSFFYDLNKRLAALATKQEQQQIAESKKAEAVAQSPLTQALNENAMGAIQAQPTPAGQRQAHVAGRREKMLNNPYQLGADDAKRKQAMRKGQASNALMAKPQPMEEMDEADYSAKKARAGKDIGKPGKAFSKIAKSAGERYGSKAAGERVAGAVLNKLRHPKESVEQDGDVMDYLNDKLKDFDAQQTKTDESALQAYLGDKKYGKEGMKALQKAGRDHVGKEKMAKIRAKYDKMDEAGVDLPTQQPQQAPETPKMPTKFEGNAFTGALAKTPKGGKFKVGNKEFTDTSSIEEADMVGLEDKMTPKQKAFAKLAPPRDKITFADKIAGAKKEVDEMLGDVAAEAMRGAIAKKKPRSAGTAFDPEVARSMFAHKDEHPRHDVKDTGYSKRYTRKAEIETGDDEEVSTEPKRRGRPKGKDKGPERVTKGSYKYKAGRPTKADEDLDTDGVMMTRQTNCSSEGAADPSAIKSAIALLKKNGYNVDKKEEMDEKAPPGEKAERMVKHIKKGYAKDGKLTPKEKSIAYATAWKAHNKGQVEEESTEQEDQKAEKAGKRVAKDIEHDEGHKAKGDNKAEKAGKKVTKDIEYDDKKDKEEKVKESNKGGYNFGGGVYESFNNKVETMINEGMSVNISVDEQGKKSISVNATDEDAEALAQLLKMAGLEGQQSQHSCPTCNQEPCGCAEVVDENSPDWPTNTETSNDALQYSGGLNKPKSTGQTTIPVIASQLRRQVSMEENVELERSLFKLYKDISGK